MRDRTEINDAGADIDAIETSEWLEALDAVLTHDGPNRAQDLLMKVIESAQRSGAGVIASLNTPYVNTISPDREAKLPGDPALERRLRSIVRWNAMAMVVRANKGSSELGGHIATYQSAGNALRGRLQPLLARARPRARRRPRVLPGTLLARQLRARRSSRAGSAAEQLDGFRQEVSRDGLASYPHPWLMPDYWQFPTVSLGIGPITSIYQARFMKYLQARGLAQTDGRKVWAFLGDGEMDEPESMGAIGARRPRAARQPDLGRQLQPPAARRPGARQRQDHPGARVRLPRRRLERDQGDLGLALGPAAGRRHRRPAGQGDGGVRRRRVPDVQVARRRIRARALLRPRPGAARARRAHVRPGDLAAQPRRAGPAEGLRRLPRGRSTTPASRP